MAHRFPCLKKSPKASFSRPLVTLTGGETLRSSRRPPGVAIVASLVVMLAFLSDHSRANALSRPSGNSFSQVTAKAEAAQAERGPAVTSAEDIRAAIDHLADIDYGSRVKAARLIRRSAPAQAVPALLRAVTEHKDSFVRFRSLVLLTGFNDARAAEQMLEVMASPNDRLREVAYAFFELHPDRAVIPRLLAGLEKETGEFVRPAIIRAMAAVGDDPKVRDALLVDVTRGVDFFRSTVIEALGDYKRAYAVTKLIEIAKLDGPLQDDAVIALGRLGDKQALATMADLQRRGAKELQPTLAAGICLLGVNCASHLSYIDKVLAFADDNPGYQDLVRPAAAGLATVAISGNADALKVLFDKGIPSMDPIRAPMALAVAKVALRNTPLMLTTLEGRSDRAGAIDLLAEGFDMLEEDLEEEQFFVTVRKAYWAAADQAPARTLAEQLIGKLDF
jgi:HEAT repeat protein